MKKEFTIEDAIAMYTKSAQENPDLKDMSKGIDETILKMLKDQNVVYHTFNGDLGGYNKIFEIIMKNINVTADKISNT